MKNNDERKPKYSSTFPWRYFGGTSSWILLMKCLYNTEQDYLVNSLNVTVLWWRLHCPDLLMTQGQSAYLQGTASPLCFHSFSASSKTQMCERLRLWHSVWLPPHWICFMQTQCDCWPSSLHATLHSLIVAEKQILKDSWLDFCCALTHTMTIV